MTREEAISELKYAQAMCEFNPSTGEVGFRNDEDRRQYEAFGMAIEVLKQEPIKHGKWENTEYINMRKCSCCQAEWGVFSNKYWNSIEDFNYCPNCGADMRGEEHEAD